MRGRLHSQIPAGGCSLLLLGLLVGVLTGCAPTARGAPFPKPTPTQAPTQAPVPRLNAAAAGSHAAARAAALHAGTFQSETYTSPTGDRMTYYLYVPRSYDPRRSYPFVLLLHGGGEIAQPGASPAQNASLLLSQPYVHVWASATVQQRWPSFVVVPQLVAPSRWVDVSADTGAYTLSSDPSEPLLFARNIVASLVQQYPAIDPRRIYLTGISIGAYGAWEMAERWPDMFAAVAPLAGAGDPSRAAKLAHLPIWAFAGSSDTIVPVSGSRNMIRAIKAAGGSPRYTEIPGASHAIWMQVYGDSAFFAWLFAQERSSPPHSSSPR